MVKVQFSEPSKRGRGWGVLANPSLDLGEFIVLPTGLRSD